jgi:hypothetical protein
MALSAPTALPESARCCECRYPLAHLPENRCPECGQTFDPLEPGTYWVPTWGPRWKRVCEVGRRVWMKHRQQIKRAAVVAVCVVLSWGIYYFRNGSFSVLFWLPGVYLLVRRRWVATAVFALCTPLAAMTAEQCYEYAAGGSDYVRPVNQPPWHPNGNPDPHTRIRGFDPGCGTRSMNYWVRAMARRNGARIMHAILGPPPGAYLGPYPTAAECVRLIGSLGAGADAGVTQCRKDRRGIGCDAVIR